MADAKPPGAIRRALHWLFSPSARWSVFALVLILAAVEYGQFRGLIEAEQVRGPAGDVQE